MPNTVKNHNIYISSAVKGVHMVRQWIKVVVNNFIAHCYSVINYHKVMFVYTFHLNLNKVKKENFYKATMLCCNKWLNCFEVAITLNSSGTIMDEIKKTLTFFSSLLFQKKLEPFFLLYHLVTSVGIDEYKKQTLIIHSGN